MLGRWWEGRGTDARRGLPGRTAASVCAVTAGCAGRRRGSSGLNSRPAPAHGAQERARHKYLVRRRPRQPRLAEKLRRTAGSRAVAVRCDARSEATARVARTSGAKGTGGPGLEAVGNGPHGRRGRRDCRSTARSADHTGGALERGQAVCQPVNVSLTAFFSKTLNRSAQGDE
jgi:hypothetical protein